MHPLHSSYIRYTIAFYTLNNDQKSLSTSSPRSVHIVNESVRNGQTILYNEQSHVQGNSRDSHRSGKHSRCGIFLMIFVGVLPVQFCVETNFRPDTGYPSQSFLAPMPGLPKPIRWFTFPINQVRYSALISPSSLSSSDGSVRW